MLTSSMPFEIVPRDLAMLVFLAFFEALLSLDNALVLALIARKLPHHQQKKALRYGLAGALGFRLIALGAGAYLLRFTWVKWIGGGYLAWTAWSHLRHHPKDHVPEGTKPEATLWKTILHIEMMDIAFAVDSIVAALALYSKFWVVFVGTFLGVVMVRWMAQAMIHLLKRFPALEQSAFLLVGLIGLKLVIEGFGLAQFEHGPWAWGFWILNLCALVFGFMARRGIPTEPIHKH
jgi:YkoY family integral membrane protein